MVPSADGTTMAPDVNPEPDEGVSWLLDVLGRGQGPNVEYLGLPAHGPIRLLAPVAPGPVAAAALSRPNDDRTPTAVAAALGGRLAGRLGLLRWGPGRRLRLPPFELVEQLGRRLGESDLAAAVTIGVPRRNRKPVLQLLRTDGRTVGFAKVGWSPLTTELVDTEARVLRLVEGRLPAGHIVPAVIHHGHHQGRAVTVATRVALPRWSRGTPPTTASTVAAIAAVERRVDQPVSDLELFDQWAATGIEDDGTTDLLRRRHGGIELDLGLWHGDLTPWNRATRGRSVVLWDWEFAGTGRPVGFDGLHQAFEQARRRTGGTNAAAVTAVVERSGTVLNRLGLNLDRRQVDATVDLYLHELLVREHRLGGQRWAGGAMAQLSEAVRPVLHRRLDP